MQRERGRSRARRRAPSEAATELESIAGSSAPAALRQLDDAAEAFAAGRDRDASRTLRGLRDRYPDAAAVRELLGLSLYRLGHYRAAAEELEEFVTLSGSTEQHPVLMDCYRAQRRFGKVDELWERLRAASPSAATVTEGRIVAAGALADQGRIAEAIRMLERRARDVRRVQEHHLRLWYALADLKERAGDLPGTRALFGRIVAHDPGFADVAERLAALA